MEKTWRQVVWLCGLVLLLIYLTLPLSEEKKDDKKKRKDPELCNRTTQQMLINPCSYLELELVTEDSAKIRCGTEIPIDVFSEQAEPQIIMSSAISDKYYTLMMINPDAANHKPPKTWLHWLVLNIKGKDLMLGKALNKASVLAPYTPPVPSRTMRHRMQFFVFEQKYDTLTIKPPKRSQFEIVKFVNDVGLCGPPKAAFEFQTPLVKYK